MVREELRLCERSIIIIRILRRNKRYSERQVCMGFWMIGVHVAMDKVI